MRKTIFADPSRPVTAQSKIGFQPVIIRTKSDDFQWGQSRVFGPTGREKSKLLNFRHHLAKLSLAGGSLPEDR
jgi:hypothetical protein